MEEKDNKKKKILVIVIAAAVVVLAVVLALVLRNRSRKPEAEPTVSTEETREASKETEAETTEAPTEMVEKEKEKAKTSVPTKKPETVSEDIRDIVIPGYVSLSIPEGITTVEPGLENPLDNKNAYDLAFTLVLADTGETLFNTNAVKAGSSCGKVTLSKALEKGTYNAVLWVQPKRLSDGVMTNNARIELALIVE